MDRKIPIAFMIAFISIAVLTTGQSNERTIQVTLKLNYTTNTIYIPGVGDMTITTLSETEYTDRSDYYIASYSNNNLKGLVFSQTTPKSIIVQGTRTSHSYTINQSLSNSQTFLVFTEGDYNSIQNRMRSIKDSRFLLEVSPTFSYGLGGKNPIKILINYTNINIDGTFIFRQGVHEITIESNKTQEGKILIINETIR